MEIEIVEGSWEHKVLESIIEHKAVVADVLMWEQDTFARACRSIANQLQHEKKRSDIDIEQIIDRKITAANSSVAYLEAKIGIIESDESLIGDAFVLKTANLESERARYQGQIEALWDIRNCVYASQKQITDTERDR